MTTLTRRRVLWLGTAALACSGIPVAARDTRRRALAIVILEGGADGLSILVPDADPAYRARRRHTGVEAGPRLDAALALHPALSHWHARFAAGELLALAGVGSAHGSRSHRAAQRELSAAVAAELAAAGVPRVDPQGAWAEQLTAAANRASAHAESCAIVLRCPGFDTHVAQTRRLDRTLRSLAQGISRLRGALEAPDRELTILVLSEFGRSPCETKMAGTHDGLAGAALLMGPSVQGGRVLGSWPALDDCDAYALPVQLETSELIAGVVRGVFAPAREARLPFFREPAHAL